MFSTKNQKRKMKATKLKSTQLTKTQRTETTTKEKPKRERTIDRTTKQEAELTTARKSTLPLAYSITSWILLSNRLRTSSWKYVKGSVNVSLILSLANSSNR